MNHVILVGRLTETPEIENKEQDQSRMVMNIAVPRTFRNQDGIYETDFIRCILWNGIAKRTRDYCSKGDVVCVRGRLQIRNYENSEMEKKSITEVIVESIAFVSSTSKKNSEEEIEDKKNSEITNDLENWTYTWLGEKNVSKI